MKKFFGYIILLSLLLTQKTFAEIAVSDPAFNPADVGFGQGDGPAGQVNAIAVQADGHIIAGGAFTYYNKKEQGQIMRLDQNGDLDPAFITGTGFDGAVNALIIQPDGKVVVGGEFTMYNGQFVHRIVRLNTDGSLDATFTPGSGADNSISSMALQTDGRILIAGSFMSYNGSSRKFVARLNADGTLDNSFTTTGTGPNLYVYSVALESSGKVIIGGSFSTINGISCNHVARLNTDGSLDNTFATGTGTDVTVSAIAIQDDSKILIGGKFTQYNGAAAKGICRLNTDGTLDATFFASTTAVAAITVQSDDKILIGGPFSSVNSTAICSIARLDTDGSLDTGFNPAGTGPSGAISSIALQSDGKVLAGGSFPSYNGFGRYRIVRFKTDGANDAAFNHGTGADDQVTAVTVLPDDKILIGGGFTSYNGVPRNHIARLNADGTLDETFDPGSGTDGLVYTFVVQPDGKIIVGGSFQTYSGTSRKCITRLNPDGSLDTSFDPGVGVNGLYVRSIILQSDGKIIIGGNFQSYNNAGKSGIARISSTGAFDVTFTSGLSTTNTVESMVMQPDGKIIIGGLFTSYNGTARNYVARINSNGSLDTSFDPGLGADNYVSSVVLQPDDKILLGGNFTSYNGTVVNHLVRLNTDGSRDQTFSAGTVGPLSLYAMLMQPDGKILLAGYFTSYNNTTTGSFARINADGSIDPNYIANTGADNYTYAIGLQSDGKIILGGAFIGYNSEGRNRITRLLTTPCTPPSITATSPASICGSGSVTLGATASAGTLRWYVYPNGGNPLTTGASYTTPVLSSPVTYYVESINAGCPSGRTAVTASVYNPKVTGVTYASRCDEGTVILKATANAGSTLDWYELSSGGASLGKGTSFTTPVISATKTYYAEASAGGCVSSRVAATATVNTTPSVLTTTPGSVCGSGQVVLKASSDAGTLKWYASETGGSSLGAGPTYTTPGIASTTTYYVEAISAGCTSARTPVIASVENIPVITAMASGSRCGAGTVTLAAASDIGTINWYASGTGGSPLGTGTSFTTPVISANQYFYVDATNGSCTSARSPIAATVTPAVSTIIAINENTVTASENGAAYQWLNCINNSSIIEGETDQSFTAPESGDYAVIIAKDGCADTSNCVNITVAGPVQSATPPAKAKNIVIAPNPTTGLLKIEAEQNIQQIRLTNPTGRVVIDIAPAAAVASLSLEEYPDGVYFIQLKINGEMQHGKLILQR